MKSKTSAGQRQRGQAGNARGFTLIEVMIAMVIIGILASMAYPAYRDYVVRTQRDLAKSAILVEGLRFEEEADLVSGVQKVAVAQVPLFRRREYRARLGGIPGVQQCHGTLPERTTIRNRYEVLEDQDASFAVVGDHLIAQSTALGRLVGGQAVLVPARHSGTPDPAKPAHYHQSGGNWRIGVECA